MKIAVLWVKNGKECHLELTEALGNRALSKRTVARWAAALQRGRVASADIRRTGRPRIVRTDVARGVISQCLEYYSDGLYKSYKHIQILIRQLCINSYEKISICIRLLQSWYHMHLLNNKNDVAMKLVVFICKGIKMKERTC